MPSFNLPNEYIRRISARFDRYRRIRNLITKNIDSYIADFINFTGTPEERSEYLEGKYLPKAPQENYLALMAGGNVRFHVKDIALLTGRDPSSVSRLLANLERSEGWYSRLVSLRHKAKSANNNTIYVYDRKIFGLIMDYREHMYLERIKRAGAVDFTEIMRLWEYLKKIDGCENSVPSENIISRFQNDNDDSQQELPDIPPASWKDVLHIIGSRLFSVKADMIFALSFAATFIVAKRFPVMIPVFAGLSAVMLSVCILKLRQRSLHTEIFADIGAVCTLLALFWGINISMDNGIYTPGGTVLNLKESEPGLLIEVTRGEYRALKDNPLVFFVNADNEADITELFYRTDSGEYKSTGRTGFGGVNFNIIPEITGNEITLEIKYTDKDGKNHGPYKFDFDVAEERFKSGKYSVMNYTDGIFLLMPEQEITIIYAFVNDTVKAVHYGVNTEKPDMVYVPETGGKNDGDDVCIIDRVKGANFVSLYMEFTDGTSTDIHIKKTEGGRMKKESAPIYDI